MIDPAGTVSATSPDEGVLPCPSCGYDLRGAESDRCSECGQIIDRALLATSGFPWAHRKTIGRFRAYVKTVWLVTIGSRKLRYETARPQELADGRSFRQVTGCLVVLAVAGYMQLLGQSSRVLEVLHVRKPFVGEPALPAWLYDLLVPWSAGIIGLLVTHLLLGWLLASTQQGLFFVRNASDAYQNRVDAIAQYTTAPMALLLPASVLALSIAILNETGSMPKSALSMVLAGCAGALTLAAFLGTMLHSAVWAARVRHAGLLRALLAVVQLLALWIFGLIVLIGVLPWCIGFVWIVFGTLW